MRGLFPINQKAARPVKRPGCFFVVYGFSRGDSLAPLCCSGKRRSSSFPRGQGRKTLQERHTKKGSKLRLG